AVAARPTGDEKRRANALIAKAMNADATAITKGMRQIEREYADRHRNAYLSPADARIVTHLPYLDGLTQWDMHPAPVDHHFWWARTNWTPPAHGLAGEHLDDGLHFFGNVSYDHDDLLQFSIGAVATFELHAHRRPSKRFNSEPKIELFGSIDGWTGFWHPWWAADDKWCKCRLTTRQTAFQVNFGQFADVGERIEQRTFIDEENETRGVNVPMPGLMNMPAIQIGGAENLSVFVQLEVRFDIELEGDSYIGFSPKIPVPNSAGSLLLRFHQWEPVPV
ncbi:MAG: hypothetical protein WBD40_15035, partial [Tepidisphaeraceae bacterium]